MKNIFRIFLNDLRSVAKNIIVFIVVIGISILPALYAWFNIAANWDPYSSTSGLSFAVCSKDKGYTYNMIMKINAGDQIIDNLKKNDKMGWTFVTEDEAINGVKDGTYYAAVVIPEDFSKNLLSLTTGLFKQAELHYYINEKKNAIAPKITDKGVEAIEESINSTYVSTITRLIATTLNLTTDQLGGTTEAALGTITDQINTISDSIDGFKTTVDVFISTIDTLDDVVKANKDTLPNIDTTLSKAGVVTDNIKDALKTTKQVSGKVTDSIEDILSSAEGFSDGLDEKLTDAFSQVETDSSSAATKLRTATAVNEKVISVSDRVLGVLEDLQETFELDLSNVINKLKAVAEDQQKIEDAINTAADTIEQKGTFPKEKQKALFEMIDKADSSITIAKEAFRGVKSTIDTAIEKAFNILDSASGLLQSVSGDIPDFSAALDDASTTLQNTKKTLNNLKDFMDTAKTSLKGLSDKINSFANADAIGSFINPIIENPQALGEFVSSPVTIKKTQYYPVENYGSGMTPFYTSLGFWVGGVILVAVMRTDLTRHELKRLNRPNSTQLFFGRYLIFFMLGQIQAWIIALGDLFFLKVQCEDPFLFIAGCLISSFVYTLIIYSLTISFSVIGKALAVIILVIQIAGSGGTFPVEVLPAPFQTVSPYLPFRYGVNALREAVAGPSTDAFIYDILMLLAFVPFALMLGLLLRKPCIKLINFFNKRVDQSDIII